MIKIYKSVGERICTVGGDKTSKVFICKEVTPHELCCANCCFNPAFPCDVIACRPEERPDGKSVKFVLEGGAK